MPDGRANRRYLFVTGRLAEHALRGVLSELAPAAGFEADVAVLPISVAALMNTRWVGRHLRVPEGTDRVILPGLCEGDLGGLREAHPGVPIERGPEDLRDLPAYFGQSPADPTTTTHGPFDIAILAEINHAPRLGLAEILAVAERYRRDGADLIDLGCDPDGPWSGVAETVAALRAEGHRVSIDSMDPTEIAAAARSGAELVLSVNASNRDAASDWGVEVVAIPDRSGSLDGLEETLDRLAARNVPYRIDPILEPIGLGFAASLGRYLEVRARYPDAEILMGVGNLTELTDCDSAGINTLLAGFCQELSIRSVLTTEVINWARTSVRELDLARRLMHHAVGRRVPPKRLEPGLVMLRDPKVPRFGAAELRQIQARTRDPNWRLYAENGKLIAFNNAAFLEGEDPFELFDLMGVDDPSHAFYLGYELAKAHIALTLSKAYRQDRALQWGMLTVEERSHFGRKGARDRDPGA